MGAQSRFLSRVSVFSFAALISVTGSFVSSSSLAARKVSSSTKVKKHIQEPLTSTKEEALRQIQSIPQGSADDAPTVMMPLKENYQSLERRAWDWALEFELFQRHLEIPRPLEALGPANLNELSDFNFATFAVGIEKTWRQFRFTGLSRGALSVKSEKTNLPTGAELSARYHWFSYGFEPRLSYLFGAHWSLGVGFGFDRVTVTQSSSDSELAQWTRSFAENSRHVFLQYSSDGLKYVAIQARQFENEFQSSSQWGFALGARW